MTPLDILSLCQGLAITMLCILANSNNSKPLSFVDHIPNLLADSGQSSCASMPIFEFQSPGITVMCYFSMFFVADSS